MVLSHKTSPFQTVNGKIEPTVPPSTQLNSATMTAQTSRSTNQSIEAAMECLDLTLESELTLFRNRHLHKESGTSGFSQEVTPNGSSSPMTPATPMAPATALEENERITLPMSDNLSAEAAQLLNVSLEEFEVEESEPDSFTHTDQPTEDIEELYPPEAYESAESHAGAIVPSSQPQSKALLPSNNQISGSATLETYTDPALEDYLESSEVLLQHLDTPIAKRSLDESVSLKWFSWAAGATLILSLFAAFFLQNMFNAPTTKSPEEADPSDRTNPENIQTSTPQPTIEPKVEGPETTDPKVEGPDLTEKEFPSVNPENLGSLPTPQPSTPTLPPPEASTPPAPEASNITTGRQYYVVTNYTDETSLVTAKQIVPDAQVVNFTAGKRIQLKQFSNEAEARTAAAQLKQQGLAVEILATASE